MSFSPVRLNHAVLFVADLGRSEHFYRGVFGMEVVAREPRANAAFLRLPRLGNHHDLGLFTFGGITANPMTGGPIDPGVRLRAFIGSRRPGRRGRSSCSPRRCCR